MFHDGSNFITNNPHLLTFTTEYNSNVYTTPVSDTGGSVILSRKSSDLVPLASLGLDFHYISGTDQTNYYAPDGSLMIPTVIGGGDQLFVGGFAQARIIPLPQLTFQGSVHGTLLAGKTGQGLQELAASWAMVLLGSSLLLYR